MQRDSKELSNLARTGALPKKSREEQLRARLERELPQLNERQKRIFLGTEANHWGRGGVALIARLSGVSRATIQRGIRELEWSLPGRIRVAGGGRKKLESLPEIAEALDRLIQPRVEDRPGIGLCWTCKSTRQLAGALVERGLSASHVGVYRLLRSWGYRVQTRRGRSKPKPDLNYDKQFHYLCAQVARHLAAHQAVVSIDLQADEPPVSEGSPWYEFAVARLRLWWRSQLRPLLPECSRTLLVLNAHDLGDGWRHPWKWALARWAEEEGLETTVCHVPPGITRWTELENQDVSWSQTHAVSLARVKGEPTVAPPEEVDLSWGAAQGDLPPGLRLHGFQGDWNYTLLAGISRCFRGST